MYRELIALNALTLKIACYEMARDFSAKISHLLTGQLL